MDITSKITPVDRFWRLLKPDAREVRDIYIYAFFNGLVGLSLPLGIQAIVNLIQGGQISTSWIVLVVVVVLGIALSGFLQFYQLRISENLQQRIFTRAAFDFTHRIPRIKMEELYRHFVPELMNRFFDVLTVQKGLSKVLIGFTAAGLEVIFGLLLLSFYHPFFILFGLILVFLIFIIIRTTARRGLDTSLEESKRKYSLAHWLQELARTASTFKMAGISELPLQRTDNQVMGYLTAREKHFKVLMLQFKLMVVFKILVATGLLAIGGILVMNQLMNIGQFIAAEIIILMVMGSVEKLVLSFETIYDILTALSKIGQVTDLELDRTEGSDVGEGVGKTGMSIELNEVCFSYPGSDHRILNNTALRIEKGEKVVLLGRSGSGKSTLIQLLAGLYDVDKGHLSYNDFPIGELNIRHLHSRIGGVFAAEQLFEGTIRENIAMGREDATDENIKWALEKLGLVSYLKTQAKGLNTMLEPQGRKLPTGLVQKLLIARSIVDKPGILLLEDVLDVIDHQERKKVADVLFSESCNWTMLLITSDPDLTARADRVIVMDKGSVIWSGNPKDLPKNIIENHA